MSAMPENITNFIAQHHVASLACAANGELWAANCFYAFDPANQRLIILTKTSTKHGELMLANPNIVGTIANQTENLQNIEGIQFAATAHLIEKTAEKSAALTLYYQRHPIATLIPHHDVWAICFTRIKHTANQYGFAQKCDWQTESASFTT